MNPSSHPDKGFEEKLIEKSKKREKRKRWRLLIPPILLMILILIIIILLPSKPKPCPDKIRQMEIVFQRVKCLQQIKQQADNLPKDVRFKLNLRSLNSYIKLFNDPNLSKSPCSALRGLLEDESEMLHDLKSTICGRSDIFQNLNCLCNEN